MIQTYFDRRLASLNMSYILFSDKTGVYIINEVSFALGKKFKLDINRHCVSFHPRDTFPHYFIIFRFLNSEHKTLILMSLFLVIISI